MNSGVFGYGSLVNRATHAMAPTFRARLSGWRRVWRATAIRPLAFLSAEPDPGCVIEGLVAAVGPAQWPALDEREYAYQRIALEPAALAHADAPEAGAAIPAGGGGSIRADGANFSGVVIYSVDPAPSATAAGALHDHPVLLSYIDVVAQGFLREFGPEGVARFFDTTTGWHMPVIDDRAAPRYPRAQPPAEERPLVDAALAARGVRILSG